MPSAGLTHEIYPELFSLHSTLFIKTSSMLSVVALGDYGGVLFVITFAVVLLVCCSSLLLLKMTLTLKSQLDVKVCSVTFREKVPTSCSLVDNTFKMLS